MYSRNQNYRWSMSHILCLIVPIIIWILISLLSSINNVELKSEVMVAKDIRDGLYDVKVIAKYPKNALKSETIINCQLTMPGTHYSKKQETVYYGKLSMRHFSIISLNCLLLLFG